MTHLTASELNDRAARFFGLFISGLVAPAAAFDAWSRATHGDHAWTREALIALWLTAAFAALWKRHRYGVLMIMALCLVQAIAGIAGV